VKPLGNASHIGRLSFLGEPAKQDIYNAALEILGAIGMQLNHEGARTMLLDAGATLTPAGHVLIPRELVERARETAPSSITVYDRDGVPAMELGGYNSYFGTGSDLMSTYDLESGAHRPSVLEDVRRAASLCDALPHIDFVMSSAHPTDQDPHLSYLLSFVTMLQSTTKPLVMTAENERDLAVMIEVARVLRGGLGELRAKPYFLMYNEPTSPLTHPRDSVEKLLLCADAGVPTNYSPAPLAGATAPITVAGHTAQGIAECLFGLVVHQLRTPGAPFLFGMGSAVLDIATAQSSYNDLGYQLGYMCAVEMAKWLDLPNWGNAGTSDSHLPDAQMGFEANQMTLLAMLAGSNLAHDVGYLDFGLTCSLESIVMLDEFIASNRRLLAGVQVDEETLALDAIAQAGPGGQFLGSKHTRRHMREVQWRPTLLNRESRENWVADGAPDLAERARRKALALLAAHETPPLREDVAAAADRLVAAYAAATGAALR
jgi:trimethylamine--corrinoid protein Co-methyltransferase